MLVLLAAVLVVGGCGADDEPQADAPQAIERLTVPQTREQRPPAAPDTATEAPAPGPAPTAPPSTAPAPTGPAAPQTESQPAPDSPQNDTPPQAGSPAERFEDYCNDNPGACG